MITAIKDILQVVQRLKLARKFHTLLSLRLDAAPVPFTVHGEIDVGKVDGEVSQLLLAALPSVRSLGEQARVTKNDGWMDREATKLENVLADRSSIDLLVPTASRISRPSLSRLCESRIQPLIRSRSILGHEMRHNVHPLAIPAQDATPHLKTLVWRNLLLEAALDGAEHDAHGALERLPGLGVKDELRLFVSGQVGHGLAAEVGDEVGSRDVEVGEVGRVGLVEVVVDLEEGRVSGGDDGLEEELRADCLGFAQNAVVEEGVEHTILCGVSDVSDLCHGVTYRPCKGHILPVEHDKEQQEDARCPARARQELPHPERPVDTPCGVSC